MPGCAITKGGKVSGLSRLDLGDICLGDLGLDGDGVQVGQFQDGRSCLGRDNGLPLFCDNRNHHPIHRGSNSGVAQVGLSRINGDSGFGDLRIQRGNLCTGGIQLGLGAFQIALRGCVLYSHLLLALQGKLVLTQQGLFGTLLGLQVIDLCG
jgi:hypothetical protein